jgi:hypothetical protein
MNSRRFTVLFVSDFICREDTTHGMQWEGLLAGKSNDG